jgi:hypothetical protein
MDGIFVNGSRPASKKAVKEAIAANPNKVDIEGTSMFGNPYSGPVSGAPNGQYHFVGPDPYTNRKFYGTITVAGDRIRVS